MIFDSSTRTSESASQTPPQASLAVLSYNQSAWVEQAVRAALAQEGVRLEIILSDDASSDDTFDKMKALAEAYQGPHVLRLNRNPNNLGLIGHVNRLFEMAACDVLFLAAADDVCRPDRCATGLQVFLQDPGCVALHTDVQTMDEHGELGAVEIPPVQKYRMTLEELALGTSVHIGASAAYRRSALRQFGPIAEPLAFEDLILGFRAALLSGLRYLPQVTVNYRVNVGLSHKGPDRLRRLNRELAVARQRAADVERLPPSDLVVGLGRLLQGHVGALQCKLDFTRSRRSGWHCLFGAGFGGRLRAMWRLSRLRERIKQHDRAARI